MSEVQKTENNSQKTVIAWAFGLLAQVSITMSPLWLVAAFLPRTEMFEGSKLLIIGILMAVGYGFSCLFDLSLSPLGEKLLGSKNNPRENSN